MDIKIGLYESLLQVINRILLESSDLKDIVVIQDLL